MDTSQKRGRSSVSSDIYGSGHGEAHLAGRGRMSRFSGGLSLAVAIDCQALL